MFRLLAILLSALACSTATAQSLDDRVRELERRVEQLEKQVPKQSGAPVTTKRTTSQSEGWRQLENWRSLRRGMTEADVRSILGEPYKVDVNPFETTWYYDIRSGGGGLRFDGHSGKLESWREPLR